MTATNNNLPWQEPGWLDKVKAWIRDQLSTHGWIATSEFELIRQRAWSAFGRISTDQGVLYFKSPAPPFFEADLTRTIARWRADCIVPLVAVDPETGWLLSKETGVTLRSLGQTFDQVRHWLKILPFYAQFQMDMADHLQELLACGVYDRRPHKLPGLFSTLLQAGDSLRVGLQPGLTVKEYHQLDALTPRLSSWCRQLADYGIPATLTHEKVHDANVLVSRDGYIFTDWSDSSIAHPFFSLLVTLRTLVHWLKMDEHGPEIRRLLETYLEPWRFYAPRRDLMEAYKIAERLGMLNRALSWHYSLENVPKELKIENADAVPEWLQDFLQASQSV